MVSPFASDAAGLVVYPTICHRLSQGARACVEHARAQYSGVCVRLCLLSDYPVIPSTTAELDYHLSSVRHCAMALVQQGHQVYWLLSAESLQSFQAEPALASAAADVLPPTCRYIVPVQPYECAGVRLLCVDQQVWHHPDLHTRLFTFVCLLQRAISCAVFHAWGTLSVAYLTAYTARFLAVPAVVSYGWQLRSAQPQQPFLWDWVARHVSAAVVPSMAEYERLLTHSPLTPTQLHVIDPRQSAVGQTLTTLYMHVSDAVTP